MRRVFLTCSAAIFGITVLATWRRLVPTASITTPATTEASHQSKPLEADPAQLFKLVAANLAQDLNNLPAIKVEYRELDWELRSLNITLQAMSEQIDSSEKALVSMSGEERRRKVELPSLDGHRVLATPAEHILNMRTTLRKYKEIRDSRLGDGTATVSREMMDRVFWDSIYEIDARRTESILTPYVGNVIIRGTWYSDESIARESFMYKFSFVYQENEWTLHAIDRARESNAPAWRMINLSGKEGAYWHPMLNRLPQIGN